MKVAKEKDIILRFLLKAAETPDGAEKTTDIIDNSISKNKSISDLLIRQYLIEMNTEGIVKGDTSTYYNLTPFGRIFIRDNGGYEAALKAENREFRRRVILDYALIVGSVGAVIAVVWKILEEVYPFWGCY